MLKLAIKAGLPLITIYTDDPVNIGAILSSIAGYKAQPYSPGLKTALNTGGLYYCPHTETLDYRALYSRVAARKAILCIVNPPTAHPATFDAGVVTTPINMIEAFVYKYGGPKHKASLVAALSGLSFKEVVEITKLAMAKHGEYTARAVRDIRRTFFGTVRGLQMLSTDFLFYDPALPLVQWFEQSGRFLTEFDVPLLTPRGLLFTGPPGTGKTMGAKFLAKELDLPLYHIDVGSLMSKFVGESEQNLQAVLKQAEQSAPCVVLFDEVEKLFHTGTDDSGVTSRLLSSILWWLQEHRSKVLTIMTTNKEADIPPELYRPGRIDSEIKFTKLSIPEAIQFGASLGQLMVKKLGLKTHGGIYNTDFETDFVSHAEVTEIVISKLKHQYLLTTEGN